MLVGKKDKDAIFVILQEHLLYQDIKKQDKVEEINYGKYIPLEKV